MLFAGASRRLRVSLRSLWPANASDVSREIFVIAHFSSTVCRRDAVPRAANQRDGSCGSRKPLKNVPFVLILTPLNQGVNDDTAWMSFNENLFTAGIHRLPFVARGFKLPSVTFTALSVAVSSPSRDWDIVARYLAYRSSISRNLEHRLRRR